MAPGRALFVRAVSDDASVGEGGEGKDDAPSAAAGSSRPVKTLPRPTYDGDPEALINVSRKGGPVEEARDLIACGINIDEPAGKHQMTALHLAVQFRRIDIVRELVRAGAAIDVEDEWGRTALQLAQQYRNADIVTILAEAAAAAVGAAPAVNESGGGSVSDAAEGKDDAPAVAAAGSSRPVKTLPRPAYEGDPQALLKFCRPGESGDVEEARDLIARGINVDEKDQYQQTALHVAAGGYFVAVVRELIRAGAALDVQDFRGKTALHCAAMRGRLDVVQELILAGAAVDVTNDEGMTALQWAQSEGRTDIAALLQEAEAASIHQLVD